MHKFTTQPLTSKAPTLSTLFNFFYIIHALHRIFPLFFKTKSLRIIHSQCSPSLLPLALSICAHFLLPIYITIYNTPWNATSKVIVQHAIDCAPNLSSLQIMEENYDKSNVFISLFSFIFLRYLAVSVMGKQQTYLHIMPLGSHFMLDLASCGVPYYSGNALP